MQKVRVIAEDNMQAQEQQKTTTNENDRRQNKCWEFKIELVKRVKNLNQKSLFVSGGIKNGEDKTHQEEISTKNKYPPNANTLHDHPMTFGKKLAT